MYFKDKEEMLLAVVLRGQRIFKTVLSRSRRMRVQTPSKSSTKESEWARPRVCSLVRFVCHSAKGKPMTSGTVKFYNYQKGFGFITPDDGGKDVFVHATALERAGMNALNEGQKVRYDAEEDRRSGKIAVGRIEAV